MGLLIPSSNTNVEPEYNAAIPSAVSVHAARMGMTQVSAEGLAGQDADVTWQSELLATAGVDVILFLPDCGEFPAGSRLRRQIAETDRKCRRHTGRDQRHTLMTGISQKRPLSKN